MNINRFFRLFFSIDFMISLLTSIIIFFVSPNLVPISTMLSIYDISVPTFSIIFSIFFSALAILISSGDNDFVTFLEEDGSYTEIIWSFSITMGSLFLSLIFSIFLFLQVQFHVESQFNYFVPKWVNVIYSFISIYALISTFSATFDVIKYANFRAKFSLSLKNKKSSNK